MHRATNLKSLFQISRLSSHRPGLYLLVVCTWLIVLAGILYLTVAQVRDASMDFLSYYIGASALQQGQPLYTQATHESVSASAGIRQVGRYIYPPTLAVMLQPMLLLSPYTASLLWFFVNVGLLWLGIGLLYKQSNLEDHRAKAAVLLLPALFTPVLMTLYLGQVNILIFTLTVLVWWTFLRGIQYVSGALLALAVWIKLWPIILIAYFLWKREWKAVSAAIIGLALIGLFTLAFGGVEQTTSFFTDWLPQLAQGTERGIDHLNQSIPGVFAKMFAPASNYVHPLIQNPEIAQQGSRIAVLLLMVSTIALCSWPIALKDREQFSTEFILVIIAAMLITGRLFESNLALVLPAYFFIAQKWNHEQSTTWNKITIAVASVMLIDLHRVIWTLANSDKQALPWFLLIFPFLGVMLLWLNFALKRFREIKTLRYG